MVGVKEFRVSSFELPPAEGAGARWGSGKQVDGRVKRVSSLELPPAEGAGASWGLSKQWAMDGRRWAVDSRWR